MRETLDVVQIENFRKNDVIVVTTKSGSVYELTVTDPRRVGVSLTGGKYTSPQDCYIYWGRIEVGSCMAFGNKTAGRDVSTNKVSRIEVRRAA